LAQHLKADRVINLWRTLESECIAERYQEVFHLPVAERQRLLGGKNFYRAVFDRCGLDWPDPKPELNGMYWSEEQLAMGQAWRDRHKEQFVIVMPLAGTCTHKVWPDSPRYTELVLEKYPDAVFYLTGDPSVAHAQWPSQPGVEPRIYHVAGQLSMKQSMLMTKFADFVIGPETGMLAAAGMFGTHKTMLATASGVDQLCRYQDHDHSIQARQHCSPCHRAIYLRQDCEDMVKAEGGTWYPRCITTFDMDEIMGITDEVYSLRRSLCTTVS